MEAPVQARRRDCGARSLLGRPFPAVTHVRSKSRSSVRSSFAAWPDRSGARRPRELVVYLAFHRNGVRHAEWSLAIWPSGRCRSSTVHSTSSDARRALGRSRGRARPSSTRRRPAAAVTRSRPTSSASRRWPPPTTRIRLLEALRLVRGPLFAGLLRTDWAVFDGTEAEIESLVVRTALRGADGFVQASGCGDEAEWMVRQALQVSPYDERLYRALLTTRRPRATGSGCTLPWHSCGPWRERRPARPARTAAHDPAGLPPSCDDGSLP